MLQEVIMLSKLKVKYIQSLGQKKPRDAEGVFIAEGPKTVTELLSGKNTVVRELFATERWLKDHKETGIPVSEVSEEELERISQLSTPNQVLAVVEKFPEEPISTAAITLALDAIQDPGNLGTIIRIADWFGVSQVVCGPGCADLYNPKVVQSTMGSIARVRVHQTDLSAWLKSLEDVAVYAAALNGEDITAMAPLSKGIILVGNESKGIDQELMSMASVKITIPRKGKAESLNAAVATGIILSHLC
jgi:TrmH family RNA methyltransferase